MKISICHYSFHRTWAAEEWNCLKLTQEVKAAGSEAVDFHVRLLGDLQTAPAEIRTALKATGLELSGLSLSNDFNQDDPEAFKQQIESVKEGIRVAAEIEAPVSRIFGGHVPDRNDQEALAKGFERILDGLGQVVQEAERLGIILALENHGGLPCSGREQADVIEKINSPNLKATIDVGNYMACGEEGHEGTLIASKHVAYVHFKDFTWGPDKQSINACTVGAGDVDHARCLKIIRDVGFDGYVALEYEGPDDERKGVAESIEYMRKLV